MRCPLGFAVAAVKSQGILEFLLGILVFLLGILDFQDKTRIPKLNLLGIPNSALGILEFLKSLALR